MMITVPPVRETLTKLMDPMNASVVRMELIPTLARNLVSVLLGSSGQTGTVHPVRLTVSALKDHSAAPHVPKSRPHIPDQKSVHVQLESIGVVDFV